MVENLGMESFTEFLQYNEYWKKLSQKLDWKLA